ncbi:MAG: hypothetical protein COY19_11385, partial [Candidatus Marinimicrobia bacterium CG_4_10_14_0_2_um_filter_48_9]
SAEVNLRTQIKLTVWFAPPLLFSIFGGKERGGFCRHVGLFQHLTSFFKTLKRVQGDIRERLLAVMLNLFQHLKLSFQILNQVQDDAQYQFVQSVKSVVLWLSGFFNSCSSCHSWFQILVVSTNS